LVVQTSATSVIVEWSQPSGAATVTGYVVHYSDGVVNNARSVPDPTSTSHNIRNLTWCSNYTFSVEAASEHISGISETFALELAEAVSSTVISVQWDHLRACSPVSHLPVKFSVKYT
ncbi:hypothetical protein GBAR_LOCUS4976, partial [Geodia barretti]